MLDRGLRHAVRDARVDVVEVRVLKVYTYSEARQRLSALLEAARRDGGVRIRRRDGETFILRPEVSRKSALDVDGLSLDLSTDEIVDFVREGRERLDVEPNDERR